MNKVIRCAHPIVLIAISSLILASCGGKDAIAPADIEKQAFEDLRTEVRQAIDDPARETEVLTVVDALYRDLLTLRESIAERNKRASELNANYDTPRADFEALFNRINTEIHSNQQRVTGSHRMLLEKTTPDEWAQLSQARTTAMHAAINPRCTAPASRCPPSGPAATWSGRSRSRTLAVEQPIQSNPRSSGMPQ